MEFLKDVVYANFAQLSYFDWHKYSGKVEIKSNKFVKGPTVSAIFDNIVNYSSILTPRYTSGKRIKKIEIIMLAIKKKTILLGKL